MTVTTEDGGRQNLFAKEPQVKVMEVSVTHNERAEATQRTPGNAWCYRRYWRLPYYRAAG